MCGIIGAIGVTDPQVADRVTRAANLMAHRGPDDWGVYSDPHAALGFRRLSIIDLSLAGHQPMISRDESAVLIFNGEIYNYRDLRKQFFGGQAYDFSENTLITAGQRAIQANKADDAIAYLQGNLEFFPNSAVL